MKAVVTGGAGFIGSHLCDRLVQLGHSVTVIDNMETGNPKNLSHLKGKITVAEKDIRDFDTIKEYFKGKDVVFHLAALPSVPRSVEDPVSSNRTNVDGTLNVLWAAKTNGIRKVVYSSSSSVYGDTEVLPKMEDMMPSPLSPYAVSKLTAEYYCRVFSSVYGMENVSLRYFNVFGPRQNPDSQYAAVIPKFIKSIISGKHPVVFGDGTQTRDFTYVADVVEANILAMNANGVGGEAMNIACGKRISINDLVDSINRILGTSVSAKYEKPRKGDILHSQADIEKAVKSIGFNPRYGFDEGLKSTIEFFKE